MEIGHVPRSHDRQEDKEVREAHLLLPPREHSLSHYFFSALSLRLFGQDITTVGQEKNKTQIESQGGGHQAETPVEHAPILDEDLERTPVTHDEFVPGETENGET